VTQRSQPTRRQFVQGLAALTGATAGTSALLNSDALAQSAKDPRFLIVLCAGGGGSIIDGPLAIRASECATPDVLNTFPDEQVVGWDGSPFRAVDQEGADLGPIPASYSVTPSTYMERLRHEMMVATWTRTSVNHAIGQRRSITGNEAWKGRTLQELVAWQYGAEAPIPNVHLLPGFGFTDHGTDATLPIWSRGQLVANPSTWPLSLDGSKGLKNGMSPDVLAAIRSQRNEVFEPGTRFERVFQKAPRLLEWHEIRGTPQERIEGLDLINKLLVRSNDPSFPITDFGLEGSPAGQAVRDAFPNYQLDPLHAQAALAFLLLKYRVSVTVTLGATSDFIFDEDATGGSNILAHNSVLNPPLAFDSSHQGHRSAQAVGWQKVLRTADSLMALLKAEDFGDGTSMWDRTLIYVASDFGREKRRPEGATEWGTSHHVNNGVAILSPLVPGNTLRGGLDSDTGLTFGFDPVTGSPEPGREMEEAEIFSGLLGALNVDTSGSGLPGMPAMRKS